MNNFYKIVEEVKREFKNAKKEMLVPHLEFILTSAQKVDVFSGYPTATLLMSEKNVCKLNQRGDPK